MEAIKYVASMKVESSVSPHDLERLIDRLGLYLAEHPPFCSSTFDMMLDLASKLQNERLLEQCKLAQSRCQETEQLLHLRLATLRRAKELATSEQQKKQVTFSEEVKSQNNNNKKGPPLQVTLRPKPVLQRLDEEECQWDYSSNTPIPLSIPGVVLRRRSYAGRASAPIYSPTAAAFKDHTRDVNLLNYQELLFSEGLITEDMSDRIVTSLPKALSDSTMRSSRESLRGSRESLHASSENLTREQKSSSVPREMPCTSGSTACNGTSQTDSRPNNLADAYQSTLNRQNKPHKKMLRRMNTWQNMGEFEQQAMTGDGRTHSVATGSSESLPR